MWLQAGDRAGMWVAHSKPSTNICLFIGDMETSKDALVIYLGTTIFCLK